MVKEHSVSAFLFIYYCLSKVMSKIEIIVKLMVEI